MTDRKAKGEEFKVEKGHECFLNVTGRHFKVKILEAGPDTVRVAFPGKDYPVEGMGAALEFYDEEGYTYINTEVTEGPGGKGEGVLLKIRSEAKRNVNRSVIRVPTDLTVQVKEQVHVRKYDAALLDLGAGGALLQTEAVFGFHTLVEITLSLPGESTYTILGQVMHAAEAPKRHNAPSHFYGIRFTEVDPDFERSVGRYIWRRLRELYPPE